MHLIFFAFHFRNFSTRPRYFRTWKSSRIIRQSFSNFFSITSSKNDVKNDVESSKNDVISMDKNISQNCLIVYQSNDRISSGVFLWKKVNTFWIFWILKRILLVYWKGFERWAIARTDTTQLFWFFQNYCSKSLG